MPNLREVPSPPDGEAAEPSGSTEPDELRFPIVGLGASAGGLKALENFFSNMPAQSGLGFVVVTHQHATQRSLLAELLGRRTEMPVVEVSHATPVQPNHVYTVSPGHCLDILAGVLQPIPYDKNVALRMPIDYFFRSLAHDQAENAIGIVLSGTGSDGSLGLQEIKGGLGMVMVQDERSAQYAGMPHSAIATQLVDYILPASKMPDQLLSYVSSLLPHRGSGSMPHSAPPAEALRRIFLLIRNHTRHDFSHYKATTVRRRIERRMNIHQIKGVHNYVRYLQTHPAEIDALFKELLIGVTSFFRDPEAWQALSVPLGELLQQLPDGYTFRAWVPGCATGEEAYSLAILLREAMDDQGRSLSAQIFATDLNPAAIDMARSGMYSEGIANDLTPQRLARFFSHTDETYRVRKEIREMLVFARHNLIADPPFTKLDLLSCRNLLIYLDTPLQRKLLPVFHYSLRPAGLLFLGSSETIGNAGELFSVSNKKCRIFQRSEVEVAAYPTDFPTSAGRLPAHVQTSLGSPDARGGSLTRLVERMLLRELVPPTILTNESGAVVHIHGRTGLFLEPAQGPQTQTNVYSMVRDGLQFSLSSAIRRAARSDDEVVCDGVEVRTQGNRICVSIRVRKLSEPATLRGLFRISFENPVPVVVEADSAAHEPEGSPPERYRELERALQLTRESHQATIEELETANEELTSTNEELQSTNEELQSANEELETSKEEMQSLNEELQTVNAELQCKLELLSVANNDMKNLLDGTDIATVFLDNDLHVKRFTEQATKVIHLIPSDVGRPVGDLVSTLHYDDLVEDARSVLRTLVFKEAEIQGEGSARYLMRILPYRTTENCIDGLVLTFVDISKVRSVQLGHRHMMELLSNSPTSVFDSDTELRYTWASGLVFGRKPDELLGRTDAELFGAGAVELMRLKTDVLQADAARRQTLRVAADGTDRNYNLYVAPVKDRDGQTTGISGIVTCLA